MEENQETTTAEVTEQTVAEPNLWGNDVPKFEQSVEAPQTQVTENFTERIETPIVEERQTEVIPQTEAQERIVEKIVEKYPEFKDDYAKELYQAFLDGKEDLVYAYLQEKNKDYNSMSEVDVIKEKLRKDFPHYTEKNIESKFKAEYGRSFDKIDLDNIDRDLDPQEYKEAVRHNDEIDAKLDLLEISATDAREYLNGQRKNVQLPQNEIKDKPVVGYTEDEVNEMNRNWEQMVEKSIPNLSDLSFNVGDEEVSYKTTNEEKNHFINVMKDFNDAEYLTKRGWYDEKGNINALKVAEDVRILEDYKKIVSSISSQLKTSSKKDVIADIKNIDLKPSQTTNAPTSGDDYNPWQM